MEFATLRTRRKRSGLLPPPAERVENDPHFCLSHDLAGFVAGVAGACGFTGAVAGAAGFAAGVVALPVSLRGLRALAVSPRGLPTLAASHRGLPTLAVSHRAASTVAETASPPCTMRAGPATRRPTPASSLAWPGQGPSVAVAMASGQQSRFGIGGSQHFQHVRRSPPERYLPLGQAPRPFRRYATSLAGWWPAAGPS